MNYLAHAQHKQVEGKGSDEALMAALALLTLLSLTVALVAVLYARNARQGTKPASKNKR